MQDLFAEIAQVAKAYPHSLALISRSGNLDYRTLVETIESIAGHALAEGLTGGQIVHVETDNDDMRLLLFLGLMRAGMTVASMLSAGQAFAQTGVDPDAVVTDRSDKSPLARRAKRVARFSKAWFRSSRSGRSPLPDAPDYALIFTSSGSTGRPKLILESRTNIDHNIRHKTGKPIYAGDVRYLPGVPLTSHGALPWYLATFAVGGSIINHNQDTADALVAATCLLRPSFSKMAPATLVNVLKLLRDEPRRFRKIDHLYLSGAYTTIATRQQALDGLAARVFTEYGSCEMSHVAWGDLADIGKTEGSVGWIVDDKTVEAVDDDGNPLPPGSEGEIRIRPAPDATTRYLTGDGLADVLHDGWFYPGDIGRVDATGQLIITGRKSTVINLGGNKISPEIVEAALLAVPGIDDVAVVGMLGEHGYQMVCALVVAGQPIGIDDINRFLKDKGAWFWIERVKRIPAIPRNANRKIDRPAVREIAASN